MAIDGLPNGFRAELYKKYFKMSQNKNILTQIEKNDDKKINEVLELILESDSNVVFFHVFFQIV